MVNQTVERLKAIYTGWRAAFKTQQEHDLYKQEFLMALIDNGINTQDMINTGIQRARKVAIERDFLPPPNRFAYWCKPQPEDFGLLEPQKAYISACESLSTKKWHHPTIWQAAQDTGVFKLRSRTESECRDDFIDCYKSAVDRFLGGEDFVMPEERRIEKKEMPPLSPEENHAHARNLLNSLWPEGAA